MTYNQYIYRHALSIVHLLQQLRNFVSGGIHATLKINRNIDSDNSRRKVGSRIEIKIIKTACGPVSEEHNLLVVRLLEERLKVELEKFISNESIRRSLKK